MVSVPKVVHLTTGRARRERMRVPRDLNCDTPPAHRPGAIGTSGDAMTHAQENSAPKSVAEQAVAPLR